MKPKKFRICPRCSSIDVRKEMNLLLFAGASQPWICNTCGFRGHLFPEIEKIKTSKKKK